MKLEQYFESLPPATERMDELKQAAGRIRANMPTRLVSTFQGPLIDQIVGPLCSGPDGAVTQLNWLEIGSGFFQQEGRQDSVPHVLADLPRRVRGLTANASKAVIFNPGQAGAVAPWWNAGESKRDGWQGFLPADPAEAGREFMHAKFIFAGRKSSAGFSRARLYIGSGNLSLAGLYSTPSKPIGLHANIEVGIVLNLDEEAELVRAKLPVGAPQGQVKVVSGEPLEEAQRRDCVAPPPILYGIAIEEGGIRLHWSSEPCESELDIGDGRIVSVNPGTALVSTDKDHAPPAAMRVRRKLVQSVWQVVPVLGRNNSFCRALAPPLMFDEVIDAVLAFPAVVGGDELEPPPGPPLDPSGGDNGKRSGGSGPQRLDLFARKYPVYLGMQLVETIADRNQWIRPDEYKAWFRHLRHVLVDRPDETTRAAVSGLHANIFTSLTMPGFAPPALTAELRLEYEKLTTDIAQAWAVSTFPPLFVGGA